MKELQPFQQRVVDERSELYKKLDNLDKFLDSVEYKALDITQQNLLSEQYACMWGYQNVLYKRIHYTCDEQQHVQECRLRNE